MVAYAEKRTLLGIERAPEHMPTLIHDLYVEGVLQLECIGYQRVGFNEPLNKFLNELRAGDFKSRTTIPVSGISYVQDCTLSWKHSPVLCIINHVAIKQSLRNLRQKMKSV
jgi:hypothetical protein